MPMCESEAAGSRPRSRSSALALIARVRAGEGSPGKLPSTHAATWGRADE